MGLNTACLTFSLLTDRSPIPGAFIILICFIANPILAQVGNRPISNFVSHWGRLQNINNNHWWITKKLVKCCCHCWRIFSDNGGICERIKKKKKKKDNLPCKTKCAEWMVCPRKKKRNTAAPTSQFKIKCGLKWWEFESGECQLF